MRRASARTPRAAAAAGSSQSDPARMNPARATTPSRRTGTCHNCLTDPGAGPLGEAEFVAIALLPRRTPAAPFGWLDVPRTRRGFYHSPPLFLKTKPVECLFGFGVLHAAMRH